MDIAVRYSLAHRILISKDRRIVYVPDDEVDIRIGVGKTVYAYSQGLPYGSLTVGEYYEYATALSNNVLSSDIAFKVVGIGCRWRHKRVRGIGTYRYRLLQIAVRIGMGASGVVVECIGLGRRDVSRLGRIKDRMRRMGYSIELVCGARGVKVNGNGRYKNVSRHRISRILKEKGLKFLPVVYP